MEIRNRNLVSLGLLVLVSAVIFVWGFFFLLGDPVLGRGMEVVVIGDDGAGLKRSDRVNLKGVQVGTVRRVELEPEGGVSIVLRVESKLRLPADTRAAVSSDVFGTNVVDLKPGTSLLALQPGDTIRGVTSPQLTALAAELGGQARTLLEAADSLLSPRAVQDLHATASVLPASAEHLRAAFAEFERTSASLRRSAEELEATGAGASVGKTLEELEASARALTGAAGAMERSLGSLASILDKVDQGDGTLGRLVNDGSLYSELSDVLSEVRALTSDVRTHPERFIRLRIF